MTGMYDGLRGDGCLSGAKIYRLAHGLVKRLTIAEFPVTSLLLSCDPEHSSF